MSYGLIYTIPFESSKGVAYVIEIEKKIIQENLRNWNRMNHL